MGTITVGKMINASLENYGKIPCKNGSTLFQILGCQ